MADAIIAVFFFMLGTAVGSFLNVCIYRLPRDESIVQPPSHCPACGERLRPLDLVPLLSFLALGRKCRYCGVPISWRYFVVEFLTGAAFLGAWLTSQEVWSAGAPAIAWLVGKLVFAGIFIAVFFIDLEHMIIPDELAFAGIAVGVVLDVAGILLWHKPLLTLGIPWTSWVLSLPASVVGIVVGAVFFVLIELFSQLVFRKEGMGGGDLKLGAAIGALLGWQLALLSFALAVVVGALVGIVLIATRLRRRHEYIPFGPFMVVCAFAVMLFPSAIGRVACQAYRAWYATWSG